MIGELITGAANIIGGLVGANATQQAGNQATQIQRETNAMQIDLANTAHQREVADLKAAGLNPLLSGTGGQGSSTPTLQAPTQSATGRAKAGEQVGNMMSQLPSAIMQYMTGQQQIELQRANAEKIRADTEAIKAGIPYIQKTAELNLQEGTQRVAESTQRTLESKARTATTEALRIPQVENLIQQIAHLAQQTKTEAQRTRSETEAANNAKQLFGSRASEAATIAAQAATYYKNFFNTEQSQKVSQRDLEIELLRNNNFLKVIEGILANEYGRAKTYAEIMSTPTKAASTLGAQLKGGFGPVVQGGRK